MNETCLVEIFCELYLEEHNRAVGESIRKLAFEAVEKIVKVSQSLRTYLLIYGLHDNMSRAGPVRARLPELGWPGYSGWLSLPR